jgi:hypothetical protein
MRVMCILGHKGILYEGSIYNVVDITPANNCLLLEVDPPKPHTSFRSERFVPLEDDFTEELAEYNELIDLTKK